MYDVPAWQRGQDCWGVFRQAELPFLLKREQGPLVSETSQLDRVKITTLKIQKGQDG